MLDVDGDAAFLGNVHHVEHHQDGDAHLDELEGEKEVSLDVRSVHDIDDEIRLTGEQVVPRDGLVLGACRQGVDARKIDHTDRARFLGCARLLECRGAGRAGGVARPAGVGLHQQLTEALGGEASFLALDGDPRPVSDALASAGEAVEYRCLPAVGVADNGYGCTHLASPPRLPWRRGRSPR